MKLFMVKEYKCVCGSDEFEEQDGVTSCSRCGLVVKDHNCGNSSIFGSGLIIEGEFDECNE